MTRSSGRSDLVEVAVDLLARTEKAILVSDGTTECWLPLSQIEIDDEAGVVVMPEWLALKKGLI